MLIGTSEIFNQVPRRWSLNGFGERRGRRGGDRVIISSYLFSCTMGPATHPQSVLLLTDFFLVFYYFLNTQE